MHGRTGGGGEGLGGGGVVPLSVRRRFFYFFSAYRCGFCGSVFCLNEVCVWRVGGCGSLRSGVWRVGVGRGGCTFKC